jgi:hypothetical protein
MKSIKFLSPLKTFVINFPKGQASKIVTKKIMAAPKISPVIIIRIFQV